MAICTLILDNFVGYCFNQFCQNNDEFQEITTGVFFFFLAPQICQPYPSVAVQCQWNPLLMCHLYLGVPFSAASVGCSPLSNVRKRRNNPAASRIRLNSMQNACTSMKMSWCRKTNHVISLEKNRINIYNKVIK